jgi:uncharacterized protein
VAQENGRVRQAWTVRYPGPRKTHRRLLRHALIAGAASGLLSGLFGVGGGFVIVPSLLYAGINIHRAVATSLMVICLISVSGVVANIVQKQQFPVSVTGLFVGGCVAGMLAGSALRSRLSGAALQKTFAVAMWLVAVFMLAKNLSTFVPH